MDRSTCANTAPLAVTNLLSLLPGDKDQAYNQFVLENQDAVYTFVYILLQDEYRASLIVQACFIELYQRHLSGNPRTLYKRLFSLAIAAVRELFVREKRSYQKQQKSGDSSSLPWSQDNIALLVSSLPLEQCFVISLVDIIGMSYEEAAEILRQPIGTVARNLARARVSRMQAVLDQDESPPQIVRRIS